MPGNKITSRDLRKIKFPRGKAKSLAISAIRKHLKNKDKAAVLDLLGEVLSNPEAYLNDPVFGAVAKALSTSARTKRSETPLRPESRPYNTWGSRFISNGAIRQMDIAMRLPIAESGALMPDAHQGYGLPIGGVLATQNAVIPYGVGVDIGCRMCLSVFDQPADPLINDPSRFKDLLLEHSRFGRHAFDDPFDDEVLDRPLFEEIPLLRTLKDKAWRQIGSSGSGNHFVEFGAVELLEEENAWGLPRGTYLGLLSHSGSRGLGANIARYYTNLAMEQCLLPKEARHLAWLSLDSEAGQEYWSAMQLAGDYSAACHRHIHRRIAEALAATAAVRIENHHNFAWKETQTDGRELIVHRKGATPAQEGVLGIIPGSMTAPGFIVRGRGEEAALHSASHGAGRQLSRRKARESTTAHALKKYLKKEGVVLIGGGLDEAPLAYKDIRQVMQAQQNLVDIIGSFQPRVVRMDE